MCQGILFIYMSAYCMGAWCLVRPEADIGFPKTGVTDRHEPHEGAEYVYAAHACNTCGGRKRRH